MTSNRVQIRTVVATLGILQILSWGSSFYLLGVLAAPIAGDTQWPLGFVVGGVSAALLVAGPVAPVVGRAIQLHGGRPVLAASSLLLAGGLALLAVSPNLVVYFVAWAVIGAGMGAGLYDPAFSTLGRLYGTAARPMITAVTLFGGFASTVAWPLTAWLLAHLGWRGACLVFACLHLGLGLPAYLLLLPRQLPPLVAPDGLRPSGAGELPPERDRVALLLLGSIVTVSAATLALVSMHLLTLLQARGMDLAAAVALGALVGPSQVAARVIELTIGGRYHPIWMMFGGSLMVAAGMLLLWTGVPLPAAALVAYGAGNGIASIVRGTVPLVLFGPVRYARLMGQLGLPVLLAMAAAPTVGAFLVEHGGAPLTFGFMTALSVVNVGLVLMLARWCRIAGAAAA